MDRFEALAEKARERARFRIAALRLEHPGEDEVSLARRLIASMSLRAGVAGAATGTLSLVACRWVAGRDRRLAPARGGADLLAARAVRDGDGRRARAG